MGAAGLADQAGGRGHHDRLHARGRAGRRGGLVGRDLQPIGWRHRGGGTPPTRTARRCAQPRPGHRRLARASPSVLCLFLLIWGLAETQAVAASAATADPLVVDVTGQQWVWTFSYPHNGNIESDQLYLPVDRPVVFHVTQQRRRSTPSGWCRWASRSTPTPVMTTKTSVTPDRLGALRRPLRGAVRPAARRHGDQRTRGQHLGLRRWIARAAGGHDGRSDVREGVQSMSEAVSAARRGRPADAAAADAPAQRRHGSARAASSAATSGLVGRPPLPADRRPYTSNQVTPIT